MALTHPQKNICNYLSSISEDDLCSEVRQLIKITYVGHSMGGMTLPMYVIGATTKGKPHHLSQAVLISPAGFHTKGRVTPYMHYIGNFFYHVLPLLVDHISLPDFAIGLFSKLQQDMIAWSVTRNICQYMCSKVVGGNGDFVKSARMV